MFFDAGGGKKGVPWDFTISQDGLYRIVEFVHPAGLAVIDTWPPTFYTRALNWPPLLGPIPLGNTFPGIFTNWDSSPEILGPAFLSRRATSIPPGHLGLFHNPTRDTGTLPRTGLEWNFFPQATRVPDSYSRGHRPYSRCTTDT